MVVIFENTWFFIFFAVEKNFTDGPRTAMQRTIIMIFWMDRDGDRDCNFHPWSVVLKKWLLDPNTVLFLKLDSVYYGSNPERDPFAPIIVDRFFKEILL